MQGYINDIYLIQCPRLNAKVLQKPSLNNKALNCTEKIRKQMYAFEFFYSYFSS